MGEQGLNRGFRSWYESRWNQRSAKACSWVAGRLFPGIRPDAGTTVPSSCC